MRFEISQIKQVLVSPPPPPPLAPPPPPSPPEFELLFGNR